MALFICTRYPRLTWISPRSSLHTTRNITTRSGSTIRSRIFALRYMGLAWTTGSTEWTTSRTA